MVSRVVGQLRIDVGEDGATIQPASNAEGPADLPHPPAPSPTQQEKGSGRDIPWPGDALREFVRFDDRGRYRPLSGAKTLPGGWQVRCPAGDAGAVIETVYPLATVHMREWERGELRVVSLDDVLERQTGRYAVAATLDEDGRTFAREVLCGDCVRSPAWAGIEPAPGTIPCPEPCSVLISLCREAALWQTERPLPNSIASDVPYAAFERAGNAIREAYLRRMA